MRIEKFSHVDNGKVVYAVIGVDNPEVAMEEVYKYKKANRKDFYSSHFIYTGLIKGNKLYRINIKIDMHAWIMILVEKTIFNFSLSPLPNP